MQTLNFLPYLFFAMPIIILAANNILPAKYCEKSAIMLGGIAAAVQLISALILFCLLAFSGQSSISFGFLWDIETPGAAYFSINLRSAFLLFCIGLVFLVSILTAKKTISKKHASFLNLLMALLLGMNGMLLVADLFSLYVFLEITGIASFVLIAMFKTEEGLEGAFKYLAMSSLATILILAGLTLLFLKNGSLAYDNISSLLLNSNEPDVALVYAALILLISGFCIKTGVAPFHSWLPDAHQSANTAVSILLSGIVIKIAGAYSLIILTTLFQGIYAVSLALVIIGMISILTGALFALRQSHFKRIVAYSSVSQMGYILLGLASGNALGLIGALFHIFNHATFKSALFCNAASLHERLNTYDINDMGGLQKRMPVTAFSSICAFLSTAGIPPFAGFWSKLLIVIALWNAAYPIPAALALILSIFTAAYFLRMQKKVFFGQLNEKWSHIKEITGSLKTAELLLTIINIAAGILFPLVLCGLQSLGII